MSWINKNFLISCLLFAVLLSKVTPLDDFSEVVFSGFVELSQEYFTNRFHNFYRLPHDEAVDFSKIEVQLLEESGSLIDKTRCSQNGFFMIPVYDRKSYRLKAIAPEDGGFEPQVIQIDLRGKKLEEIKGISEQSFIFKFSGFSLAGQINTLNSNEGPTGIKVGLFDEKNKMIAETTTKIGGAYIFSKIPNGKFKVRPLENQKEYYWNKGQNDQIDCEVSWKKGKQCTGSIIITGVSVSGSFANFKDSLKEALVFIYPKENKNVPACNLPEIKAHPLAGQKGYLCYSKLTDKGHFAFENIPNGDYELRILQDPKANKIEVSPSVHPFTVHGNPLNIGGVFKIDKFSVKGRVVDSNGNGIAGVKILLDGDEKTTSDNQGAYEIEKIQPGQYTIEGSHNHLFFQPLTNVKLDPSTEKLPNLQLSLIHVCGEVSLAESERNDKEMQNAKITIYLERQGEKRSTIADAKGKFCFEVQPGKYTLYPIISNIGAQKQEGLVHPRNYDIHVSNEPILNLNFSRPRLNIEGKVSFLEDSKSPAAKSTIVLSSTSRSWSEKAQVVNNRFDFKNVLPGTYEVSIENPNFCWEHPTQTINLNGNITDLHFKQTGFAIKYSTSRAIQFTLVGPKNENIKDTLNPSQQRYCVVASGKYLLFPDNCFKFEQSNFTVDTNDQKPVSIEPVANLVRGDVIISESLTKNINVKNFAQFIEQHIILFEKSTQKYLGLKHEGVEKGNYKFIYNDYFKPHSTIEIEVRMNLNATEQEKSFLQNLIFHPNKISLQVSDQCILNQPDARIEIRQGVLFFGEVQPAIDDWKLSILFSNNGSAAHTQQIKDKSFRIGPFSDFAQYNVTAEKRGYRLEPEIVEQGHNLFKITFTAHKLCHMEIKIVDEAGGPVPGALIFVSSTAKKNFLKLNNYTDEQGIFSTEQLVKGEYFARAVLKEYLFEPEQLTFTIEDGEHKKIQLHAKRTAYSAFGKVQTLGSVGQAGITVTAIPADKTIPTESAVSDKDGNFRVRGLIPNNDYSIVAKAGEDDNFIVKPSQVNIKTQARDQHEIDFILVQKSKLVTIHGLVQWDSSIDQKQQAKETEKIDTIAVHIISKSNGKLVNTTNLKAFKYFEFFDLPIDDYEIKAEAKLLSGSVFAESSEIVSKSNFEKKLDHQKVIHLKKKDIYSSVAAGTKKYDSVSFQLASIYFGPIVILVLIIVLFNLDSIQNMFRRSSPAPLKHGKKKN